MAALDAKPPDEPALGVDDVAELYGLLARRLEQIVRLDVRAPDAVVEDACQFAWSRLVFHRHRVRRDTAMGWLARTAVHEAVKLLRRDRRELSLDAVSEQGQITTLSSLAPGPHELLEARERLGVVRELPLRQQRAVWLRAGGLSYEEIALRERSTVRAVERQLLRAGHNLREAEAAVSARVTTAPARAYAAGAQPDSACAALDAA
jgi:DNA-directed RNA polymerase specialized sigma24 family protein